MADKNEYHIYVHFDGNGGDGKAMAGGGSGSTGSGSSQKSSGGDALANMAKKVVSFAMVKSTADKIATFEISQVKLRTGASEYEQRLSVGYSILSETVGAGAALALGAMHGGPAGFAVAAVGVAMSGFNKIMNIMQRERQLQTESNLENISIGLASVRAGVSGSRTTRQ